MTAGSEPTVLDAIGLAVAAADELVVDTVRDTHLAWVQRLPGGVGHRVIAGAVYAGIGGALKGADVGLGLVADSGLAGSARLEGRRSGAMLRSVANGLIGDRLQRERPRLAITMAPRIAGRDVPVTSQELAAAYPTATQRVAVFVHGLCEDDASWRIGRQRRGTTYAEELADLGWTPVLLRANTGLAVRTNGAELAALLERLVTDWPTPVHELALIGHSMGGLVIRAATAVQGEWTWRSRVTDVITLGTPHLGAPLARGAKRGSELLARVPELAGFGRILDQRSAGIEDLVEGLDQDFAPLPQARYRLVSATLAASPQHPVSALLGDVLVRQHSAYGRDRRGRDLFPGSDVLQLRAHHFDLLNDDRVAADLARWLA